MVWMHEHEQKLILDCLTEDTTMLEWGSGGSTLYFSSFVEKYYSIEHDKDWYEKVSEQIKEYPFNDIVYKYIQPNKENPDGRQSEYDMFKDYIDAVDNFNTKFDVVLIDGRARRLCAKKVIPHLKPDSVVFIHDYVLRTPYHVAEDYYELVDYIDYTEQTIGKLKLRDSFKENAYDLNLSGNERLEG